MGASSFYSQHRPGFWSLALEFAGRLVARWLRARELARQRRELLELDEQMLKDIGISRADAVREANRSPWDDSLARPRRSWPRRPTRGWLPGRQG